MKPWKSIEDLYTGAFASLVTATRDYPAVGWIRANRAASEDLLTEINDLHKQNAQLQEAAGNFIPKIENLSGLEDKIRLYGKYRRKYPAYGNELWAVELTWAEIFASVSPYMVDFPNDDYVKMILERAAFDKSPEFHYGENPTMDDQLFRTVAVQLEALGLVKRQRLKTVTGAWAVFWSITPFGERWMIELRTVKKVKALDKVLGPTTGDEKQ